MLVKIDLGRDFSRYPGGRIGAISDGSAEEFFDKFLKLILDRGDTAEIDLSNVGGISYSFIDELFFRVFKRYGNPGNVISFVSPARPYRLVTPTYFFEYYSEKTKEEEKI